MSARAVGKAGTKAAGVVIDDTAVTPRYVIGLSPDRELPIIAKIAVGSLKNKLLILLPVAMLLAAFAPWGITPLLMLGGAYLAFEATEKIWEKVSGDHHDEAELLAADTPAELEARQVKGAIRTDFILSAEIMAIALASLDANSLVMKGFALAAVAIAITVAVYGVVAIDRQTRRYRPAHGRAPVARDAGNRSRAGSRSAVAADVLVGHRHRGDAVGRRRDPPAWHRGFGLPRPSRTSVHDAADWFAGQIGVLEGVTPGSPAPSPRRSSAWSSGRSSS